MEKQKQISLESQSCLLNVIYSANAFECKFLLPRHHSIRQNKYTRLKSLVGICILLNSLCSYLNDKRSDFKRISLYFLIHYNVGECLATLLYKKFEVVRLSAIQEFVRKTSESNQLLAIFARFEKRGENKSYRYPVQIPWGSK